MNAIRDYIEQERAMDESAWANPTALFLSSTTKKTDSRLAPWSINQIWNEVFESSGIEGKRTPHSARHAMGKYLMEKTGNLAAVQKQLGHKNAVYSMQYARITGEELKNVLDDR